MVVFFINRGNNVQNLKFIIECPTNINQGLAPLFINLFVRSFGSPSQHIFQGFVYIFHSFPISFRTLFKKRYKKAWKLCIFSFVNYQKILTLFDVVASSGNDFDLDDNTKFIVAAIKKIKNILWNILFLDTDGITMFLYGCLE